jgi:phage gpG-like protein
MLASVDTNFINQGKDVPGGWAALAVSTIRQKKRKGRDPRKLFSEGNLARANQSGANDNSAWVSNNTIYAATQHFGDNREIAAHSRILNFRKYKGGVNKGKVRFSKESKATFSQKVTMAARRIIIPARPFMVLTEPFKVNIIDAIKKHAAM